MDKIKQLMVKSGLSEDAANAICEHLDGYATEVRKQLDEEFEQRLARVKEICLKETQEHKRELSRRVQVFLETKSATINEHLTRQAAERETEAVAKLETITAVCEGIDPNGQPNGDLQAELEKSKRVCQKLLEQRDAFRKKAERVQGVADRVIKKNRILEGKVREAGTISESAPAQPKPGKSQRIDQRRKQGKAQSTRRTLKENVDRQPPQRAAQPDRVNQASAQPGFSMTPDQIADHVEEDL